MTSDLKLQPLDALEAYCHRATIETLFNTLKNVLGGMTYHFGSKDLERASRRPKKNQTARQKSSNLPATLQTLAAIEKYVNLHLLLLGGLQLLAMRFPPEVIPTAQCWMRTVPKDIPAEFTVKTAIINLMRNNSGGFAKSAIMPFIRAKQQNPRSIEEKEHAA